jgi:hypothetical protein
MTKQKSRQRAIIARKVIKKLGGVSAAAQYFKRSKSQVSTWQTVGIPEVLLMTKAARLESEGVITRQQLYPDTWLEIWPELFWQDHLRQSSESGDGITGEPQHEE